MNPKQENISFFVCWYRGLIKSHIGLAGTAEGQTLQRSSASYELWRLMSHPIVIILCFIRGLLWAFIWFSDCSVISYVWVVDDINFRNVWYSPSVLENWWAIPKSFNAVWDFYDSSSILTSLNISDKNQQGFVEFFRDPRTLWPSWSL